MKKQNKQMAAYAGLVALTLCTTSFVSAADTAPTRTETENGVVNNYWDINISTIKEDAGLELGTGSRARGNGAIATGKNAVAIGNSATATGGNETKDTITRKLNENKQRLTQISDAERTVTDKANLIHRLQSENALAIAAGERVKQARLAKEKALQDANQKQAAYDQAVKDSDQYLKDAQAKIDDFNSRLTAVNRLGNVDINSAEGLTAAATNLKSMVETGTTLDNSVDWYKGYITNYYKAQGDLRLNNIKRNTFSSVGNNLFEITYRRLNDTAGYIGDTDINSLTNKKNIDDYRWGLMERSQLANLANHKLVIKGKSLYFDSNIGDLVYLTNNNYLGIVQGIPTIDIKTQVVSEENWKQYQEQANTYKKTIETNINNSKDPLLKTPQDREKVIKAFNTYIDDSLKNLEVGYWQWKYEQTHETKYLDNKKEAINAMNNPQYINLFKEIITERENLRNTISNAKNDWIKTNITDIEESNKITTDKLTADLEASLKINKNAITQKEAELAKLKQIADQAKANAAAINPTAADLQYAEQYERIMKQLTTETQNLQSAQERLDALKKALTLHDLTNVGENAYAIGTSSLATGTNAFAIGTGASAIGENSYAIGKGATVTGSNSIAVGTGHIVIGNNSGAFGDPDTIYGDNSYSFGNNNTIGSASTPHTVGTNTFVLGSNVTTTANNSVILGNNSTATEDNVVSVGSSDKERKIIHVAKGSVTANSTDAVTGAQLFNPTGESNAAAIRMNWQSFLGNGTNEAGNTGLITGDALHKALENVKPSIDPATLSGKANTSLDNINTAGEKVITDLAKAAVNGDLTTLKEDVGKAKTDITAIQGDMANYLKRDGSNLDASTKTVITDKLNAGANINTPTGSLVKDSDVKTYIDDQHFATAGDVGKTINSTVDSKYINDKLTKGSITSTAITVTGNGKVLDGNLQLDIANGSISKDKLDAGLAKEINDKANTSDVTNLSNNVTNQLADKANKDASNISSSDAQKWADKLGTGKAETGNTSLVTGDTVAKAIETATKDIASNAAIQNKADKDAGNLSSSDVTSWTNKLHEGANMNTPAGKLVTDTDVKGYVDDKVANSITNTVNGDYVNGKLTKGTVTSSTLTVAGAGKVLDGNLTIDVKEGSISKDKLDAGLVKEINDKANTSLNNITKEGEKVISDIAKNAVSTDVTTMKSDIAKNTGDISKLKEDVGSLQTDVSNIHTELTGKANKDASNISSSDAQKWADKLGTGKAETGNTSLVTGDTVAKAIETATNANNSTTDTKLATKANVDASNLSDSNVKNWTDKLNAGANVNAPTGKLVTDSNVKDYVDTKVTDTVTKTVDAAYVNDRLVKGSVSSSSITVTGNGKVLDGNLQLEINKGAISKDNLDTGLVKEINDKATKSDVNNLSKEVDTKLATKANTSLDNINTAGEKVISDIAKNAVSTDVNRIESELTNKANRDASNLTSSDVAAWTKALGTGSISAGNTGLVTGGSVAEVIKDLQGNTLVQSDGKTIRIGEKDTATVLDVSHKDKDGKESLRVVSGLVTDTEDATSAVNVYTMNEGLSNVSNTIQQSMESMANRLESKLSKDINKGTAIATALAGLNPLDYDPDNKLSFSASHGRYNGQSATALGAYIRPNENIMLSLAGTLSSGKNAYNAGVSFKLGPSGNTPLKKAQVANLVEENKAMKEQLQDLQRAIKDLQILQMGQKGSHLLDPTRASFPDVPHDHWAAEAVETLHGNEVVEGYPDGNFHGDDKMSRYEYAQMLYKGLNK